MTKNEFFGGSYGCGDKVCYKGEIYLVHSTDFEEALFAIDICNDPDHLSWVRCENVEFIPYTKADVINVDFSFGADK